MAGKFDFLDYAYSVEVCRDFPKIREILENSLSQLEEYKRYKCAASVSSVIEDAMVMLDLQHAVYQTIKDNKGEIDEK